MASTIVGLGYGFWKGVDYFDDKSGHKGPINGVVKSAKLVQKFNDEGVNGGFKSLNDMWREPLREGEDPFDVPIIDGLRGIVSAALAAPLEATGLTLVILRHWPRLAYRTYRLIWSEVRDSILMFFFCLAMSVLALPILVLLIPLTPLGSLAFGLGDACVQGYRHGVVAALKKAVTRTLDVHKFIKEAFDKK